MLSQSLREWTSNCAIGLRSFAGLLGHQGRQTHGQRGRGHHVHDQALPATTDTAKLIQQVTPTDADTALTRLARPVRGREEMIREGLTPREATRRFYPLTSR